MTLNFSSLKALQVHSSTVRCVHHAKRTLGFFAESLQTLTLLHFRSKRTSSSSSWHRELKKHHLEQWRWFRKLGRGGGGGLGGGYGSSNWTFTSFRMSLICNNLIESKNPGPGSVAQHVEQLLNGFSSPIVQQNYFLIYWFITSSNSKNNWFWIEFWLLVQEVMVRFVGN